MGRQHRQRQLGLDTLLAGKLGGQARGMRIAGRGRTVAGKQLRLALEAARQFRARSGQRLDRLTARLALAEADVAAGAQRLHHRAGCAHVPEDGVHVLQQPRAVECLEPQCDEMLIVGRTSGWHRRGQQHAPPQLMHGR